MNNLLPNTTYYVRSAVISGNSGNIGYGDIKVFTTLDFPNTTIGTQIWSSTNLDVTTYRDGTTIPQVTNTTQWENLTTGAWRYYQDNSAQGTIYGKLYNWYAVAGIHDNDPNTPNKILAPQGWHVPTDAEWTTLTTYLGGESVAGGKMKSTGTSQWASPNTGATNESVFTGLPGGFCNNLGLFGGFGFSGYWWSISENNNIESWSRKLNSDNVLINRVNLPKTVGFSVRCVKD